jgi:hypothetical protein
MHAIHRRHPGHPIRLAAIAALATVVLMIALTGISGHGPGSIPVRSAASAAVVAPATPRGPVAEPITRNSLPVPLTAPATLAWTPTDSWESVERQTP